MKIKSLRKRKRKGGGLSIMGFSLNKTMLELGKGFTVKRAMMMANGMFTKEQILEINRMLNKIKSLKISKTDITKGPILSVLFGVYNSISSLNLRKGTKPAST